MLRQVSLVLALGLAVSACATNGSSNRGTGTEDAATGASSSASPAALSEPTYAPIPGDQNQLNAALARQAVMGEWITSIIGTSFEKPPAGFAGVWLDQVTGTATFTWKGSPPADVAEKLHSPPDGIEAQVNETATYTLTEMRSAIKNLSEQQESIVKGMPWDISSASPSVVGAGLLVDIYQKNASQALTATNVADAQTHISSAIAMNTEVEEGGPNAGAAGGRWSDEAPWTNGAAVKNPKGGICSSGWAGQGSSGANVYLSAGHCGKKEGDKYKVMDGTSKTGALLGTVWGSIKDRDVVLMGSQGAGNAWSYDNGWNADQYKAVPTYSVEENYSGDWVCTSGAMSGAHCNLTVGNTDAWIKDSKTGEEYFHMVEISSFDSGVFTDGDSGGPVFALHNGAGSWRWGRGIISSYKTDSGFQSCATPPGRDDLCYKIGYYAPLLRTLNEFDMNLYVVDHSPNQHPDWVKPYVTNAPGSTNSDPGQSGSPAASQPPKK
jgi:hypothetical protein